MGCYTQVNFHYIPHIKFTFLLVGLALFNTNVHYAIQRVIIVS